MKKIKNLSLIFPLLTLLLFNCHSYIEEPQPIVCDDSFEYALLDAYDLINELNDQVDSLNHDIDSIEAELDFHRTNRHYNEAFDCALNAMSRIAFHEGIRLTRRHFDYVTYIAANSETYAVHTTPCNMANRLVAISRHESTWMDNAVSSVGAVGITQIRPCDRWSRINTCCNYYENHGHHCRPESSWLFEPFNAFEWTAQLVDDHYRIFGSFQPGIYVGAGSYMETYIARHNNFYRIASTGTSIP